MKVIFSFNVTATVLFILFFFVTCSLGELPKLAIPLCDTGKPAHVSEFEVDSGTGIPIEETQVDICHVENVDSEGNDNSYLKLVFTVEDSYINSTFEKCNDPLYTGDTVEFFVTFGSAFPHTYLEMEISPKDVMFQAIITNNDLDCSNFTHQLVDCDTSGIRHTASTNDKGWVAEIDMPWCWMKKSLGYPCPVKFSELRANLYRVNVYKDFKKQTEYSSWAPTLKMNPPCFHQPLYFGLFEVN